MFCAHPLTPTFPNPTRILFKRLYAFPPFHSLKPLSASLPGQGRHPEIYCKMRHGRGGSIAISLYERHSEVTVVSRSPINGPVFESVIHVERLAVSLIQTSPKLRELAYLSCNTIQLMLKMTPVGLRYV